MKVGGKGKAASHSEYISREGKYSGRERYEDLESTEYGNMPSWAEHNPAHFWNSADQHERANGATYREIEVALPRELSPEQRRELVQDFIKQELGDRHAYQWAIHTPKAAIEGGEQPHAHIMYSERTRDGIERDPEQYFKRYNAKAPERGGCRKDSAGTQERLQATRELWANVQNAHLERHGHTERVDHRSLEAQGINRAPEKHLGGRGVRQLQELDISALLERRAAEGENERAQKHVASIIDLSGDLSAALLDRERREFEQTRVEARALLDARRAERESQERAEKKRIEKESQEQAEKKRIERMSAAELTAEIQRLRPEAPLVVAQKMPDVIEAKAQAEAQRKAAEEAAARAELAEQRARQWREAHPVRAKLYDAGLVGFEELAKCERIGAESQEKAEALRKDLPKRIEYAELLTEKRRREVEASQRETRAEVSRLQEILFEKVGQEQQEARLKEQQAQSERLADAVLHQAERPQKGRESVERKMPEDLKVLVDFVREKVESEDLRERMRQTLQGFFKEQPDYAEKIAGQLEQTKVLEKRNGRDNDRGR